MPTKKFVIAVNSIFTSKLIYGITVWGGLWGLANQQNNPRNHMSISKNNMRKLQILQNKTLRLISGLNYETPTKTLLEKCNQLSVHQMVAFHTACQVFKIKHSRLPTYHHNRLFPDDESTFSQTRQQDTNIARFDFKLSLAQSSFFYQAYQIWSLLPENIRLSKNITAFKSSCKTWIKKNILVKI